MSHAIAFVGSIVPEHELPKYPAASVAGNKYQLGLLRELQSHFRSIDVLSITPTKMQRLRKASVSRQHSWQLSDTSKVHALPFVNVLILKQLTCAASIAIQTTSWAFKNRNQRRIVVIYNPISYIAIPALIISKLSRTRTTMILADVPFPKEKRGISGILKRLEDQTEMRLIQCTDSLICLTRQAADDFGNGRPALVVEGGSDESSQDPSNFVENCDGNEATFRVVFTGSLDEVSGIKLLLDAARLIQEDNIQVHIYGAGPMQSYVEETASSHPEKIVWHGKVPHSQALLAQQDANVLVSPRLPDGFVTKYTFPSKLLEYLKTGNPVLMNRLEGIGSEYLAFVNIPESVTPESWARELEAMATSQNSLDVKASKGARFVHKRKNWREQAIRVAIFLKNSR